MWEDMIWITSEHILFLSLLILLFSVVGFIVMVKYLRRKCINFLCKDDGDKGHIV